MKSRYKMARPVATINAIMTTEHGLSRRSVPHQNVHSVQPGPVVGGGVGAPVIGGMFVVHDDTLGKPKWSKNVEVVSLLFGSNRSSTSSKNVSVESGIGASAIEHSSIS